MKQIQYLKRKSLKSSAVLGILKIPFKQLKDLFFYPVFSLEKAVLPSENSHLSI